MQSNCIVNVVMGDGSDGEGWPLEMEFSQTKHARKQSWSEASSGGERSPRSITKMIRANVNAKESRDDVDQQEDWKAIEKAIGKIKYAKLLSNRKILISGINKKQQERIMKMGSLDGGKIMVHIPGTAAKLRGVISNVPMEMSMEEVKKEIQGGKVIEVKRLQTNKSGVKSDSLSVLIVFEKIMR